MSHSIQSGLGIPCRRAAGVPRSNRNCVGKSPLDRCVRTRQALVCECRGVAQHVREQGAVSTPAGLSVRDTAPVHA